MKSLIPKPLWLVPIATLALFGAGCFSSAPATPAPVQPTPTPVAPAPTPAPQEKAPVGDVSTSANEVPADEAAAPSVVDLPEVDDTWQTYTNKAETFSFRWPTKGRLAPTWEVLYATELKNGCYEASDLGGERGTKGALTVGGRAFCRTSYMDAGAGQRHLSDFYATDLDGLRVVIGFEKTLANGDMVGDGECTGRLVLPTATPTNCQEVDLAAYVAHLDQIVGTFKVLK